MKKIIKIFILLNCIFWYFFAGSLLTRLLYPLECRGFPNIIDWNIPHIIAFIFIGLIFKYYAFIPAILFEYLQQFVKGHIFSYIDMLFNILGTCTGMFIIFMIRDLKKYKESYLKELDKQNKEDNYL